MLCGHRTAFKDETVRASRLNLSNPTAAVCCTRNHEIGRRFMKLDRNKVKVESRAALGAGTRALNLPRLECVSLYVPEACILGNRFFRAAGEACREFVLGKRFN